MKDAQTLAREIQATATDLIVVTGKPGLSPGNNETVIAKIRRLYDNADEAGKNGLQKTAVRGGAPLATVAYNGKRLGVFWIGTGARTKVPTVGLRKLVKSGRLHRGHRRFAPAYWVPISELANHGNS